MISTKSLLLLLTIFSIFLISPGFSDAAIYAEGYDFGNVEVGSTQTTLVSISNLSINEVKLGVAFYSASCSDFSVVTLPESMIIPKDGSINIEIGYSPFFVGKCSADLNIYTDGSPWPSNRLTFTGIGVEQEPQQPEPDKISELLLEKLQKIIDYTNKSFTYQALRSSEQGKLPERRLMAFKKMLVVSYHLIENGHFEAAHNKLAEIYKKVDDKTKSNDFVSSDKAAHIAVMLRDLIGSFDFQYKQAKN